MSSDKTEQAETTFAEAVVDPTPSHTGGRSEGVSADNDAVDNDALDALMGGGSVEVADAADDAALDDVMDSTQQEAAKTDHTPDPEPESTDTEPPEDDSAVEPSTDELQKALTSLRRDGVPKSVLDEMLEENPQTILDWGLKSADAQAKVDGFGNRIAELEKE